MDVAQEHIITDKTVLKLARIFSGIFHPLVIPFLSFLVLFLFTYLRMIPLNYKLLVLGAVFSFTILTPALTIFLFRKIYGMARQELSIREKRYVPILCLMISYAFCFVMMIKWHLHWFLAGIILVFLILSVICILLNLKWKLSEHMAGMGSIIGGLAAFSALFGYNPIVWLCLFILLTGILGTARIILGHHTLGEVFFGFILGLLCSLFVLHPAYNFFLFRIMLL